MKKVNEPFLGKRMTFAERYPQIKSLYVEYEQMDNRLQPGEGKGSLTELHIPPMLPCKWKHCREGGFAIEQQIIARMVRDRSTKFVDTLSCIGHEMEGRKPGYHCTNHIEFKATIEYHDAH
jgi:hypothetical protein